jgi:murein DD-endopeptidase MepM/ murein hydrolase activator NlpD
VRFEGADGLARSPLAVQRVRVVRPAPQPEKAGFVFPFRDPAAADPQSVWTQDLGVDLGAHGRCGRDAVLVAVGDGVVIQEGIDGFGPTAPVLRMTSGVFAGRNVYYGHTGHNFVHVGDHVQAGQRVSTIGCGIVGYSQSPHLEIGVGVRGGPPCCPSMHQTSAEMYRQLVASDPR